MIAIRFDSLFRIALVLAVFLGMTVLSGDARTPQKGDKRVDTAVVRFIPVGAYGTELGPDGHVEVESFEAQFTSASLTGRFRDGVASGIPYGVYKARIRVQGFYSAERVVHVFQPNVIAVVALEIGIEGGPGTSVVSGQLRGANPVSGPMRIRLSGVYSTTIIDTEVNDKGGFSVTAPDGDYVLVATQQNQASQQNRVVGVMPISVSVKTGPILVEVH